MRELKNKEQSAFLSFADTSGTKYDLFSRMQLHAVKSWHIQCKRMKETKIPLDSMGIKR